VSNNSNLHLTLRARDIPAAGTLRDLIRFTARRYEDKPAFVIPRDNGTDEEKSFRAFSDDIDALGTVLFRQGLRGCRVAILGGNSYEWLLSYFAAANGGNTAVPLDRDLPAGELAFLLEDSGCAALVCAPEYEDMLPALQDAAGLRRTIRMEEIAAMLAEGRRLIAQGDDSYTGCALGADSLAAIVYTSGTTGKPKGVMLTQGNITADALAVGRRVQGAGRVVQALPLHHTFGLTAGVLIPLMYCTTNYLSRSVRNVQKDIVKTKATVLILVPAIIEVVYQKIWESARKKGEEDKLRKALKLSRALMRLGIDVRRRLFREVLDALGGELYLLICGGAPLNERITADFLAMGVNLLNGYGITECSPVVSVNPNRKNRVGSVGPPVDCCRVRIDEGGEIQVKGSNVMQGYYGDGQATRDAFTGDGWFKTGDLGTLDRRGYLYVTGRIKHLIILSNGKNVSPEELEEKLKLLPGVVEAAVYGEDGRIAAEIYADPAASASEINGAVHAMNRGLPGYKQVGLVKLRDTPFPKTTTMKIKKHSIQGGTRHD